MAITEWTCKYCGGLFTVIYKDQKPSQWGIENTDCLMCRDDSDNLKKLAENPE